MTDRETLYSGLTCMAWGCFFRYFNLNFGTVNVLPAFVGFALLLRGIRHLEGEERELSLLRLPVWILLIWNILTWGMDCLGTDVDSSLLDTVGLVTEVLLLYVQFQLFTNLAELAERTETEGTAIRDRLLKWRTWQTVTETAAVLMAALPLAHWETWTLLTTGVTVVCIFSGFWTMMAVFALRRLFRPGIEAEA